MSIRYFNKINHLKELLSKINNKEDIINFEALAWELAQTKDVFVLKELLKLFDDNFEYSEVMWGLLHMVETYKDEDYVKTILLNLNSMLPHATEWLTTILYRILNDQRYLDILSQNIYLADKKTINYLLNLMYEDSEIHREKIDLLRRNI